MLSHMCQLVWEKVVNNSNNCTVIVNNNLGLNGTIDINGRTILCVFDEATLEDDQEIIGNNLQLLKQTALDVKNLLSAMVSNDSSIFSTTGKEPALTERGDFHLELLLLATTSVSGDLISENYYFQNLIDNAIHQIKMPKL